MSNWISRPVRQMYHRSQSSDRSQEQSPSMLVRMTLLFAVFGLMWMNRGFLIPLAMAALFAATLYPFKVRLEKYIKSAAIRSGLLTGAFAVVFLLPIGVVAFLAADAGLKRIKTLPEDWTGQLQIDSILGRIEAILPLPMERADLLRVAEQAATTVGRAILSTLQGLVADLPKLTLDNIVIILGIYCFLLEAKRLLLWLRRFSPLSQGKTTRLFTVIGDLSGSVVLAALVSGAVQSGIFGIVLLVMKVPGTLLITMTAFVLSFIPVVGTVPVSIYLIGSAAIEGNWGHAIAFTITSTVVGLSDNVVRPYVISGSSSAQLHPLIGFVAAFGALETIGFYGLFLGPVVAGAVFTLVELVLDPKKA